MRLILLNLIILLLIIPVQGQEKAAEIHYICSDGIADYYEYTVKQNEPDITVYAYNTQSAAYYGTAQADVWVIISFESIYRIGHTHYAYIMIGGKIIDFAMLDYPRDCQKGFNSNNKISTIPMNECLNIDPLSLGLASQGIFSVDGNDYHYADNLSFFVPIDAIWHWDLWVDGTLILSFEQTATEACHIVEE